MKFKEGELIRVKDDAIPGGPGIANMIGNGRGLIGIVVGWRQAPNLRASGCGDLNRYWVHLQSGQNNIFYYEDELAKAKR